eukprot:gnl/TRDRNA2_/TRDRNA2_129660_c0_seq1.p1 gnl/TRDRNA2_/TRDRNA2_129660_c0~~gnl/TRDRNA2_/TRDRNA2_129660_c0_seq1.p1  ORF type:complete len:137 (+),score=0.74 gnl/TRDRNA2_/TRDRNA2_129660_c0_seq1:596-1006(+)
MLADPCCSSSDTQNREYRSIRATSAEHRMRLHGPVPRPGNLRYGCPASQAAPACSTGGAPLQVAALRGQSNRGWHNHHLSSCTQHIRFSKTNSYCRLTYSLSLWPLVKVVSSIISLKAEGNKGGGRFAPHLRKMSL